MHPSCIGFSITDSKKGLYELIDHWWKLSRQLIHIHLQPRRAVHLFAEFFSQWLSLSMPLCIELDSLSSVSQQQCIGPVSLTQYSYDIGFNNVQLSLISFCSYFTFCWCSCWLSVDWLFVSNIYKRMHALHTPDHLFDRLIHEVTKSKLFCPIVFGFQCHMNRTAESN